LIVAASLLLTPGITGCAASLKLAQLVVADNDRELRARPKTSPPNSPSHPPILFLAIDGVDRALLYDLLRKGELPKLASLLGGAQPNFPHAYFDDTLLSTMPSSTMAAWTTVITGVGPGEHGITGNEFFIREERRLGAPAPVSFNDSNPTLAIYSDDYLDSLLTVPTLYEKMREREPNILIWVAIHQLYRGADRLLFAKSTILAQAFEEGLIKLGDAVSGKPDRPDRGLYEKLDKDVIAKVESDLDGKSPVPDVLTVYLSGTDLYAHVAEEGPVEARRAYLREVVDPALGGLMDKLREKQGLEGRWVVLTSDHGHTPVLHDEKHALWTEGDDSPPGLMKKAGYRVRPFEMDVNATDDFNAVLAEGGATAFVYLADRSVCEAAKTVCDWKRPPRYQEDVLPMAQAFFLNNQDGSLAPRLRGTLDMILTRRPKPYEERDLPFEVYMGDGRTVPVGEYLAQHPHPTYIDLEARLRDLAVGQRGERAGDILLLAHNGDREQVEDRYYFAGLYRSWHGSPSRQDSEVPFIVANPRLSTAQIQQRVSELLGPSPRQQKVSDVLLDLRSGDAPPLSPVRAGHAPGI